MSRTDYEMAALTLCRARCADVLEIAEALISAGCERDAAWKIASETCVSYYASRLAAAQHPTPVCAECRSTWGGAGPDEPDYPWRPALVGEPCQAEDCVENAQI